MVTQLNPAASSSVAIEDGALHIQDLIETDPHVVLAVSEADNPEAATHSLLRIGAQAVKVASVDLSTDRVETRFQAMAGKFDGTVTQAVSAIAEAASGLLDQKTGTLPVVLADLRAQLEGLLGETFDPASKTSAISKIEAAVQASSEQLVRAMRSTLSLDDPASPLSRTRREMVEVVKEEVRGVSAELRDLGNALATTKAVATVQAKLTSKGFRYEELIAAQLEPIASIHGDIIEPVGRIVGAKGTLIGDLRVSINPDDTAGCPACFVVEAKDQPLSMTKTLAALDGCLANHSATGAIAIFANQAIAPISGPLWYSGPRAILVLDKEDPDPGILQVAYEWARWACRRSIQTSQESAVDFESINAAINRALQAIKRHQTIKACHSSIRNKVDEARGQVADLVSEVQQAITELRAALEVEPETDAA